VIKVFIILLIASTRFQALLLDVAKVRVLGAYSSGHRSVGMFRLDC
jgi:hypothetical protein